jgi:putative protein kinase ArgK-like GTPase of G3E family
MDSGYSGVELVQLENHPSRGEVHGAEDSPFAATATTKVIAETRQFGFTDLTVVEFVDLFIVVFLTVK